MCMTFGCNPQIKFCCLLTSLNLFILDLKHIDTGYLLNLTPPTSLPSSFFETLQVFL